MAGPADTVFQDGQAVSKSAVRALLNRLAVFETPAEAQALDLVGTFAIITIQSGADGIGLFIYDAADTTSAHNPAAGVIVASTGRRYKRLAISALLTSAVLVAAIADGAIPIAKISDGTANTLMGWGADQVAGELAAAEVLQAIDDAVGSNIWRQAPTSFLNPALSLPIKSHFQAMCDNNLYFLHRDGTVWACGVATSSAIGPFTSAIDQFQRLPQPAGVSFTKLYAQRFSIFAIDSDGYPWALGLNNQGQLGVGDTTNRSVWTRLPFFFNNTITVTDIFTTQHNGSGSPLYGTMFLGSNGIPYYAGDNSDGQAGDGTVVDPTTPQQWGAPTFNLTNTTLVSIGNGGSMGVHVLDSGNLYASGNSTGGKLGSGVTTGVNSTPVQISFASSNLITRIEHSNVNTGLVLSNGDLYIAGDNSDNQLADGTTTDSTSFVQVAAGALAGKDVDSVVISNFAGGIACAAVTTDGRLITWADNGAGCLGQGSTGGLIGTPAEPAGSFQGSVDEAIVAGTTTTKSLYARAGNQIFAAGENGNENLVNGTQTDDSNTFTEVAGIRGTIQDWAVFSSQGSGLQCLAVLTDEGLFTGGDNTNGKLGLGNAIDQPALQPVNLPVTFGV